MNFNCCKSSKMSKKLHGRGFGHQKTESSHTNVIVHHLFACGTWTSTEEQMMINTKKNDTINNCNLIHYNKRHHRKVCHNANVISFNNFGHFFTNKMQPKLTVIQPCSFNNILLLSKLSVARYDFILRCMQLYNYTFCGCFKFLILILILILIRPSVNEIFKKLVFVSLTTTALLQHSLGDCGYDTNLQSLYQFEARYFQCSLICNNVLFITDYNNDDDSIDDNDINNNNDNGNNSEINNNSNNSNNHNSNSNCNSKYDCRSEESNRQGKGKGKRYMIFKFGRCNPESGPLYAICQENNRFPYEQPWHCKYVMPWYQLIKFFGIKNNNNKNNTTVNTDMHENNLIHTGLTSNCFTSSSLTSSRSVSVATAATNETDSEDEEGVCLHA